MCQNVIRIYEYTFIYISKHVVLYIFNELCVGVCIRLFWFYQKPSSEAVCQLGEKYLFLSVAEGEKEKNI